MGCNPQRPKRLNQLIPAFGRARVSGPRNRQDKTKRRCPREPVSAQRTLFTAWIMKKLHRLLLVLSIGVVMPAALLFGQSQAMPKPNAKANSAAPFQVAAPVVKSVQPAAPPQVPAAIALPDKPSYHQIAPPPRSLNSLAKGAIIATNSPGARYLGPHETLRLTPGVPWVHNKGSLWFDRPTEIGTDDHNHFEPYASFDANYTLGTHGGVNSIVPAVAVQFSPAPGKRYLVSFGVSWNDLNDSRSGTRLNAAHFYVKPAGGPTMIFEYPRDMWRSGMGGQGNAVITVVMGASAGASTQAFYYLASPPENKDWVFSWVEIDPF